MTKIAEIEIHDDLPDVPWGTVEYTQTLDSGVVHYALRGSDSVIGVTKKWANKNLTPWACETAFQWKNKYWFTLQLTACVLFYEHPELAPLLSGDATDNDASKYEVFVRSLCPDYFDPDLREFLSAGEKIPPVKDLQDGDEIGILCIGVPGGIKFYTFVSAYGKKNQGLLVIGDESGAYKISARKYKENVMMVKRGDVFLFNRVTDG